MEERWLDLPAVRLHVEEWRGDGRTLICLPGQTASAHTFVGLAARVTPAHRLVAIDPRGRGKSDGPPFGYGYQIHVADTLAAIETLGLRRPVLVGHSYGAIVALCLAAWYPDVPGALVLIDGGAPVPQPITDAVDLIAGLLDTVYPTTDVYLQVMASTPWLQPWTPSLADQFLSLIEPTTGGVRARARAAAILQELRIYAGGPPSFPALWKQVRCPTLVVRARLGFYGLNNTHVLPGADYRRMLTDIGDSRGVEILANHYTVLMGDPVGTADAILSFLR